MGLIEFAVETWVLTKYAGVESCFRKSCGTAVDNEAAEDDDDPWLGRNLSSKAGSGLDLATSVPPDI